MDTDSLRFWLSAVNMLVTFAIGVWLYLEKRNDKTNERVDDLGDKFDELDKEVAGLAAVAKTAPNHADLSKVYESINRLSETVHELAGESRAQTDTLRLIQNQIMKKGL